MPHLTNNALRQTGRVSPRTSSRGGDAGSKASQNSTSPVHPNPTQQEKPQAPSTSNTLNLNLAKDKLGNVTGDGAAVPGSLGGRSTIESMPVHLPSQGFREGGEHGITKIAEGDEGA